MKRYSVSASEEAKQHMRDLEEYITLKASRRIAKRYLRGIAREIQTLTTAPYRGEARSGLKHELRTIGFRRAVSIVFRVQEREANIDIVAILYRGRLPSEAYRHDPVYNEHEF